MRMVAGSISGLDLVLITNRKLCKIKLTDIIREAIDGGVGTVQLREKDLNARDLYYLAQEIREITDGKDVNLIINDRIDIALAVNADGVHLGWQSLDIDIARKMIGQGKIIGYSAHNLEEAERAMNSGVDYVTISPIFDTASKDYFLAPLGIDEIENVKRHVNIPVIALGGINEDNVNDVLKKGADGIAVISAVLFSDNPKQSAARLKREINQIITF